MDFNIIKKYKTWSINKFLIMAEMETNVFKEQLSLKRLNGKIIPSKRNLKKIIKFYIENSDERIYTELEMIEIFESMDYHRLTELYARVKNNKKMKDVLERTFVQWLNYSSFSINEAKIQEEL